MPAWMTSLLQNSIRKPVNRRPREAVVAVKLTRIDKSRIGVSVSDCLSDRGGAPPKRVDSNER
jgi:hypothetical protein